MSSKDTVAHTLVVALLLCVVCSVLVSSSAVFLKPVQDENKALDRKINILQAAGLLEDVTKAEEIFAQRVTPKVLEISSGNYTTEIKPEELDERKAAKDKELGLEIEKEHDLAGIKRRSKLAVVYEVRDSQGKLTQVVLPVHGKGLWSTLYGFMSIASDGTTVQGLGFYEHGETPGLGGEVDNPSWKAKWIGKKLHDQNHELKVQVIKGMVREESPEAIHEVDGLSGATITSKGVSQLIRYWMGPHAFGPYLEKLRNGSING